MSRETARENVIALIPGSIPRPREIPLSTSGAVLGGFGRFENEETAGRLVQFMLSGPGEWRVFRLSELMDFYRNKGWNPDTCIDGLITYFNPDPMFPNVYELEPLIISVGGGNFVATNAFAARCLPRKQ